MLAFFTSAIERIFSSSIFYLSFPIMCSLSCSSFCNLVSSAFLSLQFFSSVCNLEYSSFRNLISSAFRILTCFSSICNLNRSSFCNFISFALRSLNCSSFWSLCCFSFSNIMRSFSFSSFATIFNRIFDMFSLILLD